jgi:hypothetical protein
VLAPDEAEETLKAFKEVEEASSPSLPANPPSIHKPAKGK